MQCCINSVTYSLIPSVDFFKDVKFMWARLALLRPCGTCTLFVHNVREYTELLSPSS